MSAASPAAAIVPDGPSDAVDDVPIVSAAGSTTSAAVVSSPAVTAALATMASTQKQLTALRADAVLLYWTKKMQQRYRIKKGLSYAILRHRDTSYGDGRTLAIATPPPYTSSLLCNS